MGPSGAEKRANGVAAVRPVSERLRSTFLLGWRLHRAICSGMSRAPNAGGNAGNRSDSPACLQLPVLSAWPNNADSEAPAKNANQLIQIGHGFFLGAVAVRDA